MSWDSSSIIKLFKDIKLSEWLGLRENSEVTFPEMGMWLHKEGTEFPTRMTDKLIEDGSWWTKRMGSSREAKGSDSDPDPT